MQTETISVSQSKAKCLHLLTRVGAGSIERIAITKRGRVIAILTPPEVSEFHIEQLYGCMKGTVHIPPALDLTAPVIGEDEFDSTNGVLYR